MKHKALWEYQRTLYNRRVFATEINQVESLANELLEKEFAQNCIAKRRLLTQRQVTLAIKPC